MLTKPKKTAQISMKFATHGGARRGAGRKSTSRLRRLPHVRRPLVSWQFPMHVTLRLCDGIGVNFRKKPFRQILRQAMFYRYEKGGFQITDFSVQGNHLHFMTEAMDNEKLARTIQGLEVSIAKRVNHYLGRKGAVFDDRYFMRVLKTPAEVRRTLEYILHNSKVHARRSGRPMPVDTFDPWSSAASFDGWAVDVHAPWADARLPPSLVAKQPRSWLRLRGWCDLAGGPLLPWP